MFNNPWCQLVYIINLVQSSLNKQSTSYQGINSYINNIDTRGVGCRCHTKGWITNRVKQFGIRYDNSRIRDYWCPLLCH